MEDYSRRRATRPAATSSSSRPTWPTQHLFETSGHLDWYKDGMYPPMEMDNGTYYPKPMNCPMHCLIFDSRMRSYRELPLRLFELGTVYRYERAGTLHGLMRIRGFTQDDSHIFCTQEQAGDEIRSLLNFVLSVLRAFGFEDFEAYLSTRDPAKSIGADGGLGAGHRGAAGGARGGGSRRTRSRRATPPSTGPKIDVDVKDAIGRRWQLSTIQFDFNMPERFELEYVGADNARHRPVMIHRALIGSIERFFGVLIEHYAGAFPTWLAPVQARVLPVATAARGVRAKVLARLRGGGLPRRRRRTPRTSWAGASAPPSWRRSRTCSWWATTTSRPAPLGVNPRGGEVERDVPLDDFVARLRREALATSFVSCDRCSSGSGTAGARPTSRRSARRTRPSDGASVFTQHPRVGPARRGDAHRPPGPHLLRHPQRLPVRHGPHPGAAVPRGGRPART